MFSEEVNTAGRSTTADQAAGHAPGALAEGRFDTAAPLCLTSVVCDPGALISGTLLLTHHSTWVEIPKLKLFETSPKVSVMKQLP